MATPGRGIAATTRSWAATPIRTRTAGTGTRCSSGRDPPISSAWRPSSTHAIEGSYAQNPAAAREFAIVLEGGDDALQVKSLAHLCDAEYDLALGRRYAADDAFARLAALDPAWGLVDHVYQSLAEHLDVDRVTLEAWRDTLERWDAAAVRPITPPIQGFGVELMFARHDGVNSHIRLYLLGRLNVRLGDYRRALQLADSLEGIQAQADAGTISRDLARSIRAHVLGDQGQTKEAIEALDPTRREVPFTRRHASWVFTQPQDRLLRARLLASSGRFEEAELWLQTVSYYPESVLAGPGHLARGEFYERRGQPGKALVEYQRLVELWRGADAELQPIVAKARDRIGQLERSGTASRRPE